jgi:hypothetical protein
VTLDRKVRIGPRHEADWSETMESFVQPFGDEVILELKFNNRFPDWFGEMVRDLRLVRESAAKYCEGISAFRTPHFGNWQRPLSADSRREMEEAD